MSGKKAFVLLWIGGWLLLSAHGQAQVSVISGTVRDINTYREIRHVSIYIKGTQRGTTTNVAGRYTLEIPHNIQNPVIVFRHIGYEPREIPAAELRQKPTVYLQPRVIILPEVTVEGEQGVRPEIRRDLPQVYSVLEAQTFDVRGFVDAGDLLRTDQSVQVEEDLSGKKVIGIRGGNPDEVVVLYNGIKLNSAYNNIFDLALIDLEDVQRFEIIKGSNTSLYGPEAFAGVVNIVPKMQLDYHLRFQQRFGTYRSGNWGIHLNPQNWLWKTERLRANYNYTRGALKRRLSDVPAGRDDLLRNTSSHHSAMLMYDAGQEDSSLHGQMSALFMQTRLGYENQPYDEHLDNLNSLYSLRYSGRMAVLHDATLSVSYKNLQENQTSLSQYGFLDRRIHDRSWHVRAENTFTLHRFRMLLGYQLQQSELRYRDVRRTAGLVSLGLESARLLRQHHGLVAIARVRHRPQQKLIQVVDLGLSLRYDRVTDQQRDAVFRSAVPDSMDELQPQPFSRRRWQETTFKFALNFAGVQNNLAVTSFIKFGLNAKFPTLLQQISSPNRLVADVRYQPELQPERNRSMELGVTAMRQLDDHPSVYGWSFSLLYFQNHYDNKFRMYATANVPVLFYDNVPDARISGFELKPTLYFYRKKVSIDVGLSRYFISEKAAFPFKSEVKRTFNFTLDHAGYSLQVLWFYEGEQVGWFFTSDSGMAQVVLPEYSNIDVHLSKTFDILRMKFFINISGRNLLTGREFVLQGLALRDRRFYITLGAQY